MPTTRRSFLEAAAATCLVAAVPASTGCSSTIEGSVPMKTTDPARARVLWYSSTGNTRRLGQAVAQGLEAAGLEVDVSDYRDADPTSLPQYDLIVLGSPVFNANVPSNWRGWLEAMPDLGGAAVGGFSTFGGPGDGQEHAATHLLRLAARRGGVPVGWEMFGCMSVFSPTWSMGNEKRTLAYRHLPDAETYERARAFARGLLDRIATGEGIVVKRTFGRDSIMRLFPASLSKLAISKHGVDTEACIGCNTCVKTCPVDAIDPGAGTVDTKACLACLGCVNNCPVSAVTMSFAGTPLVGFEAFKKQHEITILEPTA
jgi:flavodoxin/Pyruvate/2-oxoacid:ferredoxin oxidoreductase delta subunit